MKTCLVVDDSSVIRKVARRILEDLSFTILEAEDGQLVQARAGSPRLTLVPVHHPVPAGRHLVGDLVAVGGHLDGAHHRLGGGVGRPVPVGRGGGIGGLLDGQGGGHAHERVGHALGIGISLQSGGQPVSGIGSKHLGSRLGGRLHRGNAFHRGRRTGGKQQRR